MNAHAKVCVLGLPGLYQNWLIGALDPTSRRQQWQQNNFISDSDKVHWIKKYDTDRYDIGCFDYVVNCYVKPDNFVWYLYNFLEKTDGVGIMVDSLAQDLLIKGPGTIAFDSLLRHFVDSYNIQRSTPTEIIENSLIEYFYFVLTQDQSTFRRRAHVILSQAINIEYEDFFCVDTLGHLLESVPTFDQAHFEEQHRVLQQRNSRYLTAKFLFPSHLITGSLDTLSLAYVGSMITKHTSIPLDWFDSRVREQMIDKYRYKILQWHND